MVLHNVIDHLLAPVTTRRFRSVPGYWRRIKRQHMWRRAIPLAAGYRQQLGSSTANSAARASRWGRW